MRKKIYILCVRPQEKKKSTTETLYFRVGFVLSLQKMFSFSRVIPPPALSKTKNWKPLWEKFPNINPPLFCFKWLQASPASTDPVSDKMPNEKIQTEPPCRVTFQYRIYCSKRIQRALVGDFRLKYSMALSFYLAPPFKIKIRTFLENHQPPKRRKAEI